MIQKLLLTPEKLMLIQEKKICPTVGCYKEISAWEKKFCIKCRQSGKPLRYHCGRCGSIINESAIHSIREWCDSCNVKNVERKRRLKNYECRINKAHDMLRESRRRSYLGEEEDGPE